VAIRRGEAHHRTAWSPQPGPQTDLVTCPIQDVLYGGARGGGKTDGLIGDAASRAQDFGAHFKGILFRRTYDELEEVISRSQEILRPVGWAYNVAAHNWVAPNGATLKLRYLDRDEDASHYQGHSYCWMGFDELGNWPSPLPIDKLWACLRSAHGVPCVRRSTANPGGPGHTWVKERYRLGSEHENDWGRPFWYRPLPDDQPALKIEAVYIRSLLEDNPLLMQGDPEYEHRLAAVGSKALYEAWRYGRWDVVVGAVFDEWHPDIHILPKGFRAPRGWKWAAGMDWGYSKPGWLGLFAAGPDGDIACMEELYFRLETARKMGFSAGQLCAPYPVEYIAADEQMWQKVGTGQPTLAEEFQAGLVDWYGSLENAPQLLPATHGRGSRPMKVQMVHRYLKWSQDPKVKTPAALPWGRPLLRVHPSCKALIRTLPALPYDASHPEDVDTTAEDHPYDGLSAYLNSRPVLPEAEPAPPDPETHPGFDKGRNPHRRRPQAPWEREMAARQEADRYAETLPHYRVPKPQPLRDDDDL
jgi:terminase large subunit-like protein